jgi:hypothetical protein
MDESSSQITLFANFDSGNMAKYERVPKTLNTNSNASSTSITSIQSLNPSSLPSNTSNNTLINTNSSSNLNVQGQNDTQTINNTNLQQQKFDIEFNVWTKPDCSDSQVGLNSNRYLYIMRCLVIVFFLI